MLVNLDRLELQILNLCVDNLIEASGGECTRFGLEQIGGSDPRFGGEYAGLEQIGRGRGRECGHIGWSGSKLDGLEQIGESEPKFGCTDGGCGHFEGGGLKQTGPSKFGSKSKFWSKQIGDSTPRFAREYPGLEQIGASWPRLACKVSRGVTG
ncbi:hypothetical protein QE152_g21614 [Popillia japonica]|uniref:Uncharacterized protein n=1 Tax=Popillia japonica TaxID=7064 RepID=A0AAW1KNH0_POPJA